MHCCTTSGLQWDLHHQRLEMGHLVSSSNHIVGGCSGNTDAGNGASAGASTRADDSSKTPMVMVETSDPVLWMTTLIAPSPPS